MGLAPRNGTRAPRFAWGFTLIEVLVTVVIIAIIAMIGVGQVSKTMRRARLDGAARDIQAIVQRATTEMKMRGHATFLRLEPNPVTGTRANWRVTLWADVDDAGATPPPATADNNKLDDPGDTLIRTWDAPADISFSTADTTVMATANWSGTNPADATTRYLICDFLSRTSTPGPPVAQTTQMATLDVTQQDMVPATGVPRLSPPVRYQLRIPSIWNPVLSRGVWNSATSKWSDQ